jgi:NAD+ synthase (glutamine-hydrolysing)
MIKIHQTHHNVADFNAILKYLEDVITNPSGQLHLFPELYLTGYPLQDLCLQKPFISRYLQLIKDINELSLKQKPNNDLLLMGALEYKFDGELVENIYNVIYQIIPGQEAKAIYSKMLLPNYDIFDEKKYFTPGEKPKIINWNDKNIALQICEDMWPGSFHKNDPTQMLAGEDIDLIVNLSASPFNLHKEQTRIKRAQDISNFLKAPFVYVNRVGGEDEILFDGHSFVVNGDKLISEAKCFAADTLSFNTPEKISYSPVVLSESNTWEDLFTSDLVGLSLPKLDEAKLDLMVNSLNFGIKEYALKAGFKKITIALSGGMDSCLVLTLLKLLNDFELEALYMPTNYSSDLSQKLSKDLCKNLEVPLTIIPIQSYIDKATEDFRTLYKEELDGLALENIQSRIRGSLLYTRSNQIGSMVVNTSNKSELAVGYSTLYGDSVGAISMLGDVFKSEVYQLANYINQKYNNLIPEEVITRAPSAELREDQKDTDSLPPYEVLDAILAAILSYRYDRADLIKMGFKPEDVDLTFNLYRKNEFKRNQFPPIVKIKSKSFGFGYRVPLSKNSSFYSVLTK